MNDTSARVSRLVRFGVFEIDLRSGELRKSGVRLNLQQQPLQLLSVLLEQPGELVTREELRRRLWHDDTFVDFDHGLNAAVKRLRDTLGDSAESPRFIETVARRGYRFIAPASEPDVVEATGARRGSLLWRIVWAATGMGTAALITVILVGRARPSALPGPLLATSIFVDGVALNLTQHGVHFAVAPSGRTVVFTGSHGGQSILYRRDLDRLEPEPMIGTEGGSDAFFSLDGRWLGFEKSDQLWTAPLDGGTPQMLLPNQPLRGGTWGEGDRIVFGRVGSGLWMASPTGSKPRQLTVPKQGERHELPQLLPGGRAVLFTILPIDKPPSAAVHLIETGETRALFEGVGARFVGSGHIMFGWQEKLWAVGFDPDSLQVLGEAHPVRDDIFWSPSGYPQFAADAGVLAYVRTSQASRNFGKVLVTRMDRDGSKETLPIEANDFGLPRLSPAGDRFVVQIGASRDLWMYDLRRRRMSKLTSDHIVAYSAPVWTADGKRVVFTTWFDGEVGLAWVPSDASGPVEQLVKGIGMRSFERTHPVLLPDGSGLIMMGLAPGTTVEDLLFVPLDGERRLEVLFHASGVERNPAIEPGGRFIAYDSDESRRSEVYVRPFPNAGSRKWPISNEGGVGPVWTRDGTEIVYKDNQGRIMTVAVRIDGNGEFHPSTAKVLFTAAPGDGVGLDRHWDVTADGKRFVFLNTASVAEGRKTALEMVFLQNWTDELKRLVPRKPQ
jgi:eukaryotic-like serine/threonine-protein kinase